MSCFFHICTLHKNRGYYQISGGRSAVTVSVNQQDEFQQGQMQSSTLKWGGESKL